MTTNNSVKTTDRAATRGKPPLYYVIPFILSLGLHYGLRPLSFTFPTLGFVNGVVLRNSLGAVLIMTGVVTMVATLRQFRSTGNDPMPETTTNSIISAGPFRLTRNPLYLATAIVQTGIGIGIGSLWVLGSVVIALILAHYWAVLPEEAYLEGKFGEQYLAYKRSVRRWI